MMLCADPLFPVEPLVIAEQFWACRSVFLNIGPPRLPT